MKQRGDQPILWWWRSLMASKRPILLTLDLLIFCELLLSMGQTIYHHSKKVSFPMLQESISCPFSCEYVNVNNFGLLSKLSFSQWFNTPKVFFSAFLISFLFGLSLKSYTSKVVLCNNGWKINLSSYSTFNAFVNIYCYWWFLDSSSATMSILNGSLHHTLLFFVVNILGEMALAIKKLVGLSWTEVKGGNRFQSFPKFKAWTWYVCIEFFSIGVNWVWKLNQKVYCYIVLGWQMYNSKLLH